jgi:uncharacterized protein YbjT (DUF2867 family)
MLGLPVAIALMEAGFEVTALVRNAEQARRSLPAQIAVVQADVRDEASLRKGLAGQDGLYLNLSVAPNERHDDFHTEGQGIDHILSAAREAGIVRIGYLSALIHDTESNWWVLDLWRTALTRIKASGIAYTIFYPTNFMETLPQRHVSGNMFVMIGRSLYGNYWIAGRDFGRQVARSFSIPQAANREYYIQGPEPLTYLEAAQRYAQARGKPLHVTRVPMLAARVGGAFSRGLAFNARMMKIVLNYPEEFKAEEAWRDLGRPTTTIEEFARLQAADAGGT